MTRGSPNGQKKASSSWASAWSRNLQEYGHASSLHGVGYATDAGQPAPARLAWAAAVAMCLSFAVMLSGQAHSQWRHNRVLTSVSTIALPVEEVEFPAITICAQGTPFQRDWFSKVFAEIEAAAEEQGLPLEDPDTGDWHRANVMQAANLVYPGLLSRPPDDPQELVRQVIVALKALRSKDPDLHSAAQVALEGYPLLTTCALHASGVMAEAPPCSRAHPTADAGAVFGGAVPGECVYMAEEPGWAAEAPLANNVFWQMANAFGTREELLSTMDRNWTSKYLTEYAWTGVTYDAALGRWRYIGSPHLMGNLDKFRRVEGFPDLNSTSFRDRGACMKARLSSDPAYLFEYTADACLRGRAGVMWMTRTRCSVSLESIVTDWLEYYGDDVTYAEMNGYDFLRHPLLGGRAGGAADLQSAGLRYFMARFLSAGSRGPVLRHMWKSNLPCFDVEPGEAYDRKYHLLKHCQWKGRRLPCHRVFSTVATDMGLCCAFNAERAEAAYRESGYLDTVARLRGEDLEMASGSNGNDTQAELELDMTTQSGAAKGLTVVLDGHSDHLQQSSVSTDFNGFVGYVSHRLEYPWPRSGGFLIEPGRETLVRLGATVVSADRGDIGHIDPESRGCYFHDDARLGVHRRYTMANCIYECSAARAGALLAEESNATAACVPWFFIPVDDGAPFCDPWQARRFLQLMGDVSPRRDCARCLPDCQTTTYSVSHSSTPFRSCNEQNMGMSLFCHFESPVSPWKFKDKLATMYDPSQMPAYALDDLFRSQELSRRELMDTVFVARKSSGNHGRLEWYDAYQRDIAKVTFFFDSPTAVEFKKQESLSQIGFISQVGGLVGLFMGFSFLSLLELAYWFTYRLAWRLKGDR